MAWYQVFGLRETAEEGFLIDVGHVWSWGAVAGIVGNGATTEVRRGDTKSHEAQPIFRGVDHCNGLGLD